MVGDLVFVDENWRIYAMSCCSVVGRATQSILNNKHAFFKSKFANLTSHVSGDFRVAVF